MILLEIPDNPNCPSVEQRVFHDVEPARPVFRVRLSQDGQPARWYDVTGWTAAGTPCPAWVQKVDDSGEGVAFLLYGGDAGLRLRPTGAGDGATWQLEDSRQWGESFFLLPDASEVEPHG